MKKCWFWDYFSEYSLMRIFVWFVERRTLDLANKNRSLFWGGIPFRSFILEEFSSSDPSFGRDDSRLTGWVISCPIRGLADWGLPQGRGCSAGGLTDDNEAIPECLNYGSKARMSQVYNMRSVYFIWFTLQEHISVLSLTNHVYHIS